MMKLKDVFILEKESDEIWVVSPDLHYDTEDDEFKGIVKHNLETNTKYRYIVANTESVRNHLNLYQEDLNVSQEKIAEMFLLLPESEFNPFLNELAIYNPHSKDAKSCLSVWKNCDENDEIISFDDQMTKENILKFSLLWEKYKRSKP